MLVSTPYISFYVVHLKQFPKLISIILFLRYRFKFFIYS